MPSLRRLAQCTADGRRAAAVVIYVAVAVWLAACGDDRRAPSAPPAAPGVLYGPGAHWIDFVDAGTVRFAARATVAVDLDGDDVADAALDLRGDTVVHRSASYSVDPVRRHRNHLDLEIVAMRLTAPGIDLVAGDGIANLTADGPLFSIGSSDEVPDAAARANDRFAVAFAATIGGRLVRGETPLAVHAAIDRLPPLGSVFTLADGPLRLVDDAGRASGLSIVGLEFVPTALLATDDAAIALRPGG